MTNRKKVQTVIYPVNEYTDKIVWKDESYPKSMFTKGLGLSLEVVNFLIKENWLTVANQSEKGEIYISAKNVFDVLNKFKHFKNKPEIALHILNQLRLLSKCSAPIEYKKAQESVLKTCLKSLGYKITTKRRKNYKVIRVQNKNGTGKPMTAREEKIFALNDTMSISEIAEYLNVQRQAVWSVFKKHGTKAKKHNRRKARKVA